MHHLMAIDYSNFRKADVAPSELILRDVFGYKRHRSYGA